ncbi:hypothetical protein CE91St36_07730 [Christensenellaceae bacterium]|nr:hypothetical protein CE91St36_07730 [Christensenellaceae bacterium]BDF60624.1 hypothetical protein CE91St37_07740 [Christensenellaceae bacterium]
MRVNELTRFLLKNGVTLKREGGRHDLYYSPLTHNTFPISRHHTEELPAGTLAAILRQAGLKQEVS